MSWHEFGKSVGLLSPAFNTLFNISGGNRVSGIWKDGKRFAYNGYYEEWGGCVADVFIVASEVLNEE